MGWRRLVHTPCPCVPHAAASATPRTAGYRQDFSWIKVPGVLAGNGAPYQRQGVSPVPGVYFVGLHRMWEAGSGTLLDCGWAATNVADHVTARLAALR